MVCLRYFFPLNDRGNGHRLLSIVRWTLAVQYFEGSLRNLLQILFRFASSMSFRVSFARGLNAVTPSSFFMCFAAVVRSTLRTRALRMTSSHEISLSQSALVSNSSRTRSIVLRFVGVNALLRPRVSVAERWCVLPFKNRRTVVKSGPFCFRRLRSFTNWLWISIGVRESAFHFRILSSSASVNCLRIVHTKETHTHTHTHTHDVWDNDLSQEHLQQTRLQIGLLPGPG